jgi:hypothetical protein
MIFTKRQYEHAIRALQDGMKQLEPDGNECSVCGDSDHQAWQCHHNPLRAMAWCEAVHKHCYELHESLHWLEGYNRPLAGGAGIFAAVPFATDEEEDRVMKGLSPQGDMESKI